MTRVWICAVCVALICCMAGCAAPDTALPLGTEPSTEDTAMTYTQLMETRLEELVRIVAPRAYQAATEEEGVYLCADIENNSGVLVKNIKIAFAAWDADNQPVALTGFMQEDEASGSYYKELDFGELMLENGQTWVADTGDIIYGLRVKDVPVTIADVRAWIISYELEDGTTCLNQYYAVWKEMLPGKELTAEMKAYY